MNGSPLPRLKRHSPEPEEPCGASPLHQGSALAPAGTLSLHPFSGSNNQYLSYGFPVLRGEPCGVSPLHPTRGIAPGPNSGTGILYVASNVPVKESNMHTYFCRERMCFCELGAPQLHAETPSLIRMVVLRAGCGTAATQNSLCKGRLHFCELGAALLHAETPMQRKIVRLRDGCPHCGPRRNPFAKEDCIFANWVPALRATGWAV